MEEPGLDTHEWESEWASLEAELEDSPAETLPAIGDLIERILRERGVPIDEPARDGTEEIVVTYHAAREVSDRVDRNEDVDPGDIAFAIQSYREIYGHVLAQLRR